MFLHFIGLCVPQKLYNSHLPNLEEKKLNQVITALLILAQEYGSVISFYPLSFPELKRKNKNKTTHNRQDNDERSKKANSTHQSTD